MDSVRDIFTEPMLKDEGHCKFVTNCVLLLEPEQLKAGRLVSKTWKEFLQEEMWKKKYRREEMWKKKFRREKLRQKLLLSLAADGDQLAVLLDSPQIDRPRQKRIKLWQGT